MEPPKPRVNTFMKTKQDIDLVDPISIFFIVSQNLCGLNKMAALGSMKPKFFTLALLYSVTLNVVFLYFICVQPQYDLLFEVVVFLKVFQHLVNCFLNLILQRKLRRYYEWIRKFDTEIEATLKITSKQTLILVQPIVITIYLIAVFIYYGNYLYLYLPFYLPYYMETHLYGHLIGLLRQRLRLINDSIESPFSVNPDTVLPNVVRERQKTFKGVRIHMNNVMDYYQTIVSAFEVLTDAIQWQFVAIVATSFFFLLAQSLKLAILIINKKAFDVHLQLWIMIPVTELLSLLVPCVCCDMLRAQVRRLRELVASKLYDDKLDKSGRSNARALLALTETRNLSFSLLRIIDISITLPFTFVGLLITYLIILLQFHKVLDFKI